MTFLMNFFVQFNESWGDLQVLKDSESLAKQTFILYDMFVIYEFQFLAIWYGDKNLWWFCFHFLLKKIVKNSSGISIKVYRSG